MALTIHGLNLHVYRSMPEGLQRLMTDYEWFKWVAAVVLIVSVLLNLAVERAIKSGTAE